AENRRDPDQERVRLAFGIQDQLRLLGERLTLVPTLRYERLQDQGSEFDRFGRITGPASESHGLWNPALGAGLAVMPWLELRGNLGLLHRAPSFSERFGNRGSIQGNPALEPERGIVRDIGFRLKEPTDRFGDLRVEYAYFNNDIDDMIFLRVQSGVNAVIADNARARLRGHELSLSLRPVAWMVLDANYTHQDSENRDRENPGKQLPLRPRDEVYGRLQFGPEPWQAYYEINWIGENFLAVDNLRTVADRLIHTAGGKVAPWPWLSLGLEARNFGNDRAEDASGYPLPGRSFFGTLKATL
ncbi:MAG TPA: TonB-dependent receptor, partial [Terriglobales bacterium]|nr:TonB-dependent receptor [Terriglobales bacterium]